MSPSIRSLSVDGFKDVNIQALITMNIPLNLPYIHESKLQIKQYGQSIIKASNYSKSSIFIVLPFLEQTQENQTEYCKLYPFYVYWIQISNTTQTLLSSVILKEINAGFSDIFPRHSIISNEKYFTRIPCYLQKMRQDDQFSQLVFHFIGYNTSYISDDRINFISQSKGEIISTPIIEIFNSLEHDFITIFDGSNSGCALDIFKKFEVSNSDKIISNGKDFFVLCSCSSNESMPKNPYLPRDFLTSTLLSPVRVLILCFLINYYPEKLTDHEFQPLTDIDPEITDYLNQEIIAITETIAYECLPKELFLYLFRTDDNVAKLFQRFILAQYLLSNFNIHPVSYPELPQLQHHHAWSHLRFTLEKYVLSKHKIISQNESDLFQSVISSFFKNINSKNMDKTVINVASIIPSIFSSAIELYAPLSYYASLSPENRNEVIGILNFKKLFSLLFKQMHSTTLYHSIAYLTMTSLMANNKSILSVVEQPDLQFLFDKIMDRKVSPVTRTILTAILTRIVDSYQSAHNFFITEIVFKNFCSNIKELEIQPLIWQFILMKQVFKHFSIDRVNFHDENVHIQISALMMHNSYELRASMIALLSNFMQTGNPTLNRHLFTSILPLCLDMSYLVRYQFLMFIIRYLASSRVDIEAKIYKPPSISSFSQFFDVLFHSGLHYSQLLSSFSLLQSVSARIASNQNSEINCIKNGLFIINFLTQDPSPIVRETAIKALDLFKKHDRQEVAPPFNSSSQNLATIQSRAEVVSENFDIPDDFSVLYSNLCAQLLKSEQWNQENYQKPFCKENNAEEKSFMPSKIKLRNKKLVGDRHIERLAFVNREMVVQTSPKTISILENNLALRKSFTFPSVISSITTHNINQTDIVSCATNDGVIHLYDPKENSILTSFRSTMENSPQIITTSLSSNKIAVSGGQSSNAVRLFDISCQKFIGEWNIPDKSTISCLYIHENDENLCICGLNNGYLVPVDFRDDQMNKRTPLGVRDDKVINICGIRCQRQVIYASTASGRIMSWDVRGSYVSLVSERRDFCTGFDSSPNFPILFYSSTQDKPAILSPSGQKATEIDCFKGSMICTSKENDLVAFAETNGNVQVFEVLL
ncbi:hypothetical protein TVAG_405180 [Trichomonas vaginalis G3]|uniref:Raptor N-terminal CASPase-like domain-containing protein n=1 Tax=Trichomonas vaginalis (strain ATCC PRA-98 / G3) TaxID=412133 RepID=A2E336_TRIV3|nr:TOR signaling [Trichomonas vaginalis G3]EAY12972.1 hypothetical protein TVAG_405180 [Trichomonas vaginalis G3]KAI5499795.1 TOR signaling [Trichomonas vaginalis G3]|eukprot:XP_001325195.1 hypothetical protein [Trichomonas vaginalis G3]